MFLLGTWLVVPKRNKKKKNPPFNFLAFLDLPFTCVTPPSASGPPFVRPAEEPESGTWLARVPNNRVQRATLRWSLFFLMAGSTARMYARSAWPVLLVPGAWAPELLPPVPLLTLNRRRSRPGWGPPRQPDNLVVFVSCSRAGFLVFRDDVGLALGRRCPAFWWHRPGDDDLP